MNYLTVYASLNQVQRIKSRLSRDGVYADMIRTPRRLSARGCSFALVSSEELLPQVRRASKELGIELRGVFAETEEGYREIG